VFQSLTNNNNNIAFQSKADHMQTRWTDTLLYQCQSQCKLIACSRHPSASLCSCQRPHCSVNKHSTWWQEFLVCGSENLEQSTHLTAAAWHWIWTL